MRKLPSASASDLSSRWQWATSLSLADMPQLQKIAAHHCSPEPHQLRYVSEICHWWLKRTGQPTPDEFAVVPELPPDPFWCPVLLGSEDPDDGRLGFVEVQVKIASPGSPRGDAALVHNALETFVRSEGWTSKHFAIESVWDEDEPPEGTSHTLSVLIAAIARLANLAVPLNTVATGAWDAQRQHLAPVDDATLQSKLFVAQAWGYKRLLHIKGQTGLPVGDPLQLLEVPADLKQGVPFLLKALWGQPGERQYIQALASSRAGDDDVFVPDRLIKERFVGREKDLIMLRGWSAARSERCPIFWIHGPEGIGKTWLAAKMLTSAAPGTCPVRFQWSRDDPRETGGGRQRFERFRAILVQAVVGLLRSSETTAGLSLPQLVTLLRNQRNDAGEHILIFIDKYAEVGARAQERLLAELTPLVDAGAKVLVTSRHLPSDDPWIRAHRLHPLARAEVRDYVARALAEQELVQPPAPQATNGAAPDKLEAMTDKMFRRSGGLPRFLDVLSWHVNLGASTDDWPDDFRDAALNALQHALLAGQNSECLALLYCAKEPLALDQLVSLIEEWRWKSSAENARKVEAQLSSLGGVVQSRWMNGKSRYKLAQPIYRDLIASDSTLEACRREAAGAFCDWCAKNAAHGDLYAMRYLATHLFEAKRYAELFSLATNNQFLARQRTELGRGWHDDLQPLALAVRAAADARDFPLLLSFAWRRAAALSRGAKDTDVLEVLSEDGLDVAVKVASHLFDDNVNAHKLWTLVLVLHPSAAGHPRAVDFLFRAFRHRDARERLSGGYLECAIELIPLVFLRVEMNVDERDELLRFFTFNVPSYARARLAVSLANVGAFGLAEQVVGEMDRPPHGAPEEEVREMIGTRIEAMRGVARQMALAGHVGPAINFVTEIRNGFGEHDTTASWAWAMLDCVIEPCIMECDSLETAQRSVDILKVAERRADEGGETPRISTQLLAAEAMLLLGRKSHFKLPDLMLKFDGLFAQFHDTLPDAPGSYGAAKKRFPMSGQPSQRARLALIATQANLMQLSRWHFDLAWESALKLQNPERLAQLNWVAYYLRAASQIHSALAESLPARLRQIEHAVRHAAERAQLGPAADAAASAADYLSPAVGNLARAWAYQGDFSRATYVLFALLPRQADRWSHEHLEALAEIAVTMFDHGHDYRRLLRRKDARALHVIPRVTRRLLEKGEISEALELVADYAASVRRPNPYMWADDLRRTILALRWRADESGVLPRLLETPSPESFLNPPPPWMYLNLADAQALAGLKWRSSRSCEAARWLIANDRNVRGVEIPGIAREMHRLGQDQIARECFAIADAEAKRLSPHASIRGKLSLLAELAECCAAVGDGGRAADCLQRFCAVADITGIDQDSMRMAICDNVYRLGRAAVHQPDLIEDLEHFLGRVVQRLSGVRPPGIQRVQAILLAMRGRAHEAELQALRIRKSQTRQAALGDVCQALLRMNAVDAALQIARGLKDGKPLKQFIISVAQNRDLSQEQKLATLCSLASSASAFVDATVRLGIELLRLVDPPAQSLVNMERAIEDALATSAGRDLGAPPPDEVELAGDAEGEAEATNAERADSEPHPDSDAEDDEAENEGDIAGNFGDQVADFMLDFVNQNEGFGEIVETTEDIRHAEDADQLRFGANEHIIDIAPVGGRVDKCFGINEPGGFHAVANGKVDGLDARTPQVCHPLAEASPCEYADDSAILGDGQLRVAAVHHAVNRIP